MKKILAESTHREYPYPTSPWVMTQTWEDLLFAHWRFPPAVVRGLVPSELNLDTFDGSAWVGVVPFKMRRVRPRYVPRMAYLSDFLELNVRTYVEVGGIRGVYFFSLDASSLFAVEGARLWFHLPYYYADMFTAEKNGRFHYKSKRIDKRGEAVELDVRYGPIAEVSLAGPGSLEQFLTERYCLYTESGDNQLLRAHIHHMPWPLQSASAEFKTNTMLSPLGLDSEGEPLLHFAKTLLTVEWAPEAVPVPILR